mgnify:CR=1 FL=1
MFINFGFEDFGKQEVYTIEVKMGNQMQRQRLQGAGEMVALQFIQLLEQARKSNQPVRLKISKEEEIWNQFKQELKNIENYIQFANKKYMEAFPEEFKE